MKAIHTEVVVKKDPSKRITGLVILVNGVELPCAKEITVQKLPNQLTTITVTMIAHDAPGIKFDVQL